MTYIMKLHTLLVGALFVACLSGCTRADHSTEILRNAGYENIHITGYAFFGCSEDDTFHTGFEATSKTTGNRVTGVVCSGWLKGSTIRID